mgnify:CR=1 FL=1
MRRAERIGYDLWGGVTQNNRTYLFIRSIMHVDRNLSFFIRRGAIFNERHFLPAKISHRLYLRGIMAPVKYHLFRAFR